MTASDLKKYASVALTTFLGAVVGYLMPLLASEGVPTDATKWKSLAVAGALAGVSAIVHLFQAPPSTSAAARAMARAAPLAALLLAVCVGTAPSACTPSQLKVVESGIPADAQLIGCVLATALGTSGDLAAVAAACSTDALTVAQILMRAVTTKGAVTKSQAEAQAKIAATPACREAVALAHDAGK